MTTVDNRRPPAATRPAYAKRHLRNQLVGRPALADHTPATPTTNRRQAMADLTGPVSA